VNCHREPCPVRGSLSQVAPISVNVAGWPYDVESVKKVTYASKRKIRATASLRFPAPSLTQPNELMTAQYGEMNASFIRVLNLQRMLYENETGYIDALESSWTSSVALSGFLLEGGLMAPDSVELDMPTSGIEGMESMDRTSGVFHRPSDFP
jgi:hypothetical protein